MKRIIVMACLLLSFGAGHLAAHSTNSDWSKHKAKVAEEKGMAEWSFHQITFVH